MFNHHDALNNLNQAERPDLSFWLSVLLMFVGCICLNLFKPTSDYISQELSKIDSRKNEISKSNLKYLVTENPDSIQKLTQEEIIKLFDQPDFIRQEADILIWQYKSKDCVYEIFWDISGQEYNVLHTNFRTDQSMMTESLCLKSLF